MGHCWTMTSIEIAHSPPYYPFGIRLSNESAREILEGPIKAPVRVSSALVGRGVVRRCDSNVLERTSVAQEGTLPWDFVFQSTSENPLSSEGDNQR